jgi:hypothetical protein
MRHAALVHNNPTIANPCFFVKKAWLRLFEPQLEVLLPCRIHINSHEIAYLANLCLTLRDHAFTILIIVVLNGDFISDENYASDRAFERLNNGHAGKSSGCLVRRIGTYS